MHHPRQDNTDHILCYTSRGALAGMRNGSMGPPWGIDPTIHRTMSERSYHGTTSHSWLEWEIPQWVHHEGSIQQSIAPWANALTTELHLVPGWNEKYLNGSNDPSHHERILYHEATSCSSMFTKPHLMVGTAAGSKESMWSWSMGTHTRPVKQWNSNSKHYSCYLDIKSHTVTHWAISWDGCKTDSSVSYLFSSLSPKFRQILHTPPPPPR